MLPDGSKRDSPQVWISIPSTSLSHIKSIGGTEIGLTSLAATFSAAFTKEKNRK